MHNKTFEISWGSLWKVFFFVVLASALFTGYKVLLGLFLAIVISSGLEFVVDFLERRGIPRTLGVVLIFLAIALGFIIFAYTIIPFLIVDLNTVLLGVNKSSSWLAPLLNYQGNQSLDLFLTRVSSQLLSGNFSPLSTFSDILGSAVLVVAVIFSSFYLSLSHDGIERFIRAVFPDAYEARALRIYTRSRRQIGFWFRTQIILSIAMMLMSGTALVVLQVQHAFLLAVLSGVFELLPFVGPILSGAIAVAAAFSSSPSLAFYTLIVFLLIHQFEAHVLVPLLTRRAVGLHPVVVITAILVGVELAGFLGAIIAVPAAAVLQEIIEEWPGKKPRASSDG